MASGYRAGKRLMESEKLPLGHYDRRNAQEEVRKVYALCRDAEERLWNKWMPKRCVTNFHTIQEAANFCGFLCRELGTRMIKRVVANSVVIKKEFGNHCSGLYCVSKKEIHLPGRWYAVKVLIHETAHHIAGEERYGYGHGKEFVEVLELLYEIAAQWFKEN